MTLVGMVEVHEEQWMDKVDETVSKIIVMIILSFREI